MSCSTVCVNPEGGVWRPGNPAMVTWYPNFFPVDASSDIQIDLYQGKEPWQQSIVDCKSIDATPIVSKRTANSGQSIIILPKDAPNGGDFYFRVLGGNTCYLGPERGFSIAPAALQGTPSIVPKTTTNNNNNDPIVDTDTSKSETLIKSTVIPIVGAVILGILIAIGFVLVRRRQKQNTTAQLPLTKKDESITNITTIPTLTLTTNMNSQEESKKDLVLEISESESQKSSTPPTTDDSPIDVRESFDSLDRQRFSPSTIKRDSEFSDDIEKEIPISVIARKDGLISPKEAQIVADRFRKELINWDSTSEHTVEDSRSIKLSS